MARTPQRSTADIRHLLEDFDRSNLTRREFRAHAGIAVSTLDYYRRRHTKQRARDLVPVTVLPGGSASGFTVTLRNGRRIESAWEFPEALLTRLVQALERS